MLNQPRPHQTHEDGFTLIELLIVVLIIGILAAIAIPVYLGIQNNAHKVTLRADVNTTVKRVQVALTEGVSLDSIKNFQSSYRQNSDGTAKGEDVYITDSVSAGSSQFNVNGSMLKANGASLDYIYVYDSATGKFSENSTDLVLGGGSSNTVPVITTSNLPGGVVGTAYNQQLAATGSPAPTSFKLASGSLPAGLNLNTATGAINGTPTTPGTYTFGVTATSAVATSQERSLSIVVTSAPVITSTALPDATVGTAYDYTVTTSGNPNPTFSATGLPSGLSIEPATGRITGTPAASAGATSPNVTITANNGVGGDQTKTLPLNVNAAAPTITTTSLPDGAKIGNSYTATLASTGGTGTVTWTKTSGALPSGLSLSSGGVISGTPTGSYANYTFSVTATASGKTSSAQSYTIKVAQDISLNNGNVELGNNGEWYSYWTVSTSTSSTFGAVNNNAHGGSWSEYFKTLNNAGSTQGVLYCPNNVSYSAGTRVRWTAYVSGVADSWSGWGGTPQYNLHVFSRANNWDGWGAQDVTVNGASNWQKVSEDFTVDGNTGNLCFGAVVPMYSATDYFKEMWVDDVTLTLGG